MNIVSAIILSRGAERTFSRSNGSIVKSRQVEIKWEEMGQNGPYGQSLVGDVVGEVNNDRIAACMETKTEISCSVTFHTREYQGKLYNSVNIRLQRDLYAETGK